MSDNKLRRLLAACAASVSIQVNPHRDCYQTVDEWLADQCNGSNGDPWPISEEVRAGMRATNTIVEIHFYPLTPIGFHHILHFDMDAALDEALEVLGLQRRTTYARVVMRYIDGEQPQYSIEWSDE